MTRRPGPQASGTVLRQLPFLGPLRPPLLPRSPSPLRLAPADTYLISSSTGLSGDSIPHTPVDVHGDNDLSVPSPYHPNSPLFLHRRHVNDVDDMIDSTVDSSGFPVASQSPPPSSCVQSSHYEDSSDDEGAEAPVERNQNESISTSGQVDDGHFRLVPNAESSEPAPGPSGTSGRFLTLVAGPSAPSVPAVPVASSASIRGKGVGKNRKGRGKLTEVPVQSSDDSNVNGNGIHDAEEDPTSAEDNSNEAANASAGAQHSSILERMTGPLSKRLRTLHALQEESKVQNGRGDGRNPPPPPPPPPPSSSGTDRQTFNVMIDPIPSTAASQAIQNAYFGSPDIESVINGMMLKDEKIILKIEDKPVMSRAEASLPSGYLCIQEVSGQKGVFAKKPIPKDCRFGPLEGRQIPKRANSDNFQFLVTTPDATFEIDVSDDTLSNWMRFVRVAKGGDEQNLALNQEDDKLYFSSTRDIRVGDELKVWYSSEYAVSKPPSSLPSSYLCIREVSDQKRVFAKKPIPKGCRFGPLKGRQIPKRTNSDNFRFIVTTADGTFEIDVSDETLSNWMRFVRVAKDANEQNLALNQEDDQLYFSSTRDINVGEELKVWYSSEYAASLGLNPLSKKPKFKCKDCDAKFSFSMNLSRHRRAAHRGKSTANKCELCYKTFSTSFGLSKHMAVHGSDEAKPLVCPHCGKRLINNSALACHIKVHAKEGNSTYDCPICGSAFGQMCLLKDHIHIHRKDGVYTCPTCSKTFPEYSMIRKHIRAFHSAKRFSCEVCAKSFTGADKLKAHLVRYVCHSTFFKWRNSV